VVSGEPSIGEPRPLVAVGSQTELRQAIEADELELHFQPVVDLATDKAIGVESLVRWQHPGGGLLAPDDFLPAVEQTPVITALTCWVLRAACAAASRWPDWTVAVNISARDLVGRALIECVNDALHRSGVSADRLVLEVTETDLVRDVAQAAETLGTLRKQGVGVALDDFGTGYSSLLYLRDLPVTSVKIDRAFIAGVDGDGDDRAIVTSLLTLARTIGLSATAEGVETAAQARVLRGLGCPVAQGFWWSRPVTAEAMDTLYRDGLPDPTHRPRPTRCQPGDSSDPYLVDLVTPLLAQGASLRTIAAALNAAGERTSAGARWHPASVARLISTLA
jgi:EAL domain-containing protein (putative c-di-GMP-specific phosphodiesterase class I)